MIMLVIGIVFVLVIILIDVIYFLFIEVFFLILRVNDDLKKLNLNNDIVLNILDNVFILG